MKAKGIRIAIIAIAGVGLFAFQGMKQESAQSANAQAFGVDPIEKTCCYYKHESGGKTIIECGSCKVIRNAKGINVKEGSCQIPGIDPAPTTELES